MRPIRLDYLTSPRLQARRARAPAWPAYSRGARSGRCEHLAIGDERTSDPAAGTIGFVIGAHASL
jgi:hypothetical protein